MNKKKRSWIRIKIMANSEMMSPSGKGKGATALPDVDYQSLLSRDRGSIDRFFSSAMHYGVFRVTGHGISDSELSSLVRHAEQVFGILDARNSDRQRTPRSRNSNRDELAWVCSDKESMISAREYIGPESFQEFSHYMDNVSKKLDAIAKELGQVFLENVAQKYRKRIQQRESVISLYRYKHDSVARQRSPDTCVSLDHALSLHLAFQKCHFTVQLEGGPSVFNAGPNTVIVKEGPSVFEATPHTIIVTVGHQLQKWSKGEFKAAVAELKLEPQEEEGNAFSIELKCSPTYLNQGLKKRVTVFHHFLIGLALVFAYKAFVYFSSSSNSPSTATTTATSDPS